MKTVVLDTNVYLSAIIFGGNPRHILDLIIEKKIISYISPAILLEISNKLEKKFKWKKEQIKIIIKTLASSGTIVYPNKKIFIVKKDKNDNKIIETAVEAKAEFIVTGDNHLLEINKYKNIRIVTSAEFISYYQKKTK